MTPVRRCVAVRERANEWRGKRRAGERVESERANERRNRYQYAGMCCTGERASERAGAARCSPQPPHPDPLSEHMMWAVWRRGIRRATHKGTSEGACTAAGCKADLTSTTSLSAPPLAPSAPPSAPCQRATHKETSEGACTAAGCKADPTSTTSLSAPPLAPGAPPSTTSPLAPNPLLGQR